jgi:hypothetical protein
MKYCPSCGAEYVDDRVSCSDCGSALIDAPLDEEAAFDPARVDEPVTVLRTGRRLDAELARGRLEADGIQAWIWSSGMGPWRMESALTEVTGVPNAFNAHQLVVAGADEERAREILDEPGETSDPGEIEPDEDPFGLASGSGLMQTFRTGWVLKAFAFATLAVMLWTLFD